MPVKRAARNCSPARSAMMAAAVAGAAGFAIGSWARAEAPVPAAIKPLLATGTTVAGEKIVYPVSSPARVSAVILTLAPGQETGWHTHGVPTFGYVIDGEVTVDYGAKGQRTFRTGEALMEAIGQPHNGRNTGAEPMRILAVYMGAEGLSNSKPQAAPDHSPGSGPK